MLNLETKLKILFLILCQFYFFSNIYLDCLEEAIETV